MRRVIVTGSSSGIGRAIAERLLADGWNVIGFDVSPAAIEHQLFEPVEVNLTDRVATEAAAKAALPVSAFVHAAGVLRVAPLGMLDDAEGELMWRLHVAAATRIANVVVPAMAAAKQGRVVLIGSRIAAGVAGRSQYAATKAALVGLARSWAAEVVASGVTVNVVSPAATQTAMLDDPKRKSEAPKMPPMGRLIRPGEIAGTVAFLLSEAGAAITGQDIQICGGSSLPR